MGSGFPVGKFQAINAAVFRRVVSNKRQIMGQGYGGNLEIIGT